MKRILFIISMLFGVAYGQLCADEDTVRSNAVTLITANTARVNGTVSHFTGAPTSLQLRYVRVGQTDTATASSTPTSALRNLTGLQAGTAYYYYYKTICGSGTRSQTIGAYTFTTLANTIFYAPERPTIFNHVKVDSSMIIPAGDTVVGREPSTGAQIRYKTSNNTFYGYYPSCTCWRPLAIDSAGIIALLDGKVDSVTVSGDSLFYWKVGVSYGYILPALNDVWRNTGNTGIDTSVNWLGTNDANDLVVKTNNTRKFTINGNGALGIGDPADYGTSLYRLKSAGSAGPPVWGTNTISELTGATGTNSIDNSGYGQSWSWNGLASGNGFALSINNTTAVSGQTVVSISTSGANASANRTTYGVAITNNRTGTNNGNNSLYSAASGGSAYNRAGWFTASGASGNNYGGYFSAAGGTNNYSLFAGEGDVALNQVSGSTYIGTTGSVSGIMHIAGSTSGLITIQPQAAAGTYNFNLPTTAGSSGDVLTSAGGGGSAMTWTTPSSSGANTALSNLASVAVNTSLLPGTDNSIDVGGGSKQFRYGIYGTGIAIGAAAAPAAALDIRAADLFLTSSSVDQRFIIGEGLVSATDCYAISWNRTDNQLVLNEGGAAVSMRLEGDANANLFFADATNDRVGIKTATPDSTLTVSGSAHITGYLKVDTDPLIYEALVTETGGVQSAIVLKNTTGTTFTLSSADPGAIKIDAVSGTPFTASKTLVYVSMNADGGGTGIDYTANYDLASTSRVTVFTYSGGTATADIANKMSVRIVIYP